MTNAFEEIIDAYYYKSKDLTDKINFVEEYHQKIIDELFDSEDKLIMM